MADVVFDYVFEGLTVGALLQEIASLKQNVFELQRKNKEYEEVILQMRAFSGEILEEKISVDEMSGHDLLGTHGKILVIGGQELGENVMYGIAKAYGFVKKDFEYLDYDKVKGYMERICRNGKYRAVIFGASPHKTTGCLGYSSSLEMMRQEEGMPFIADARNYSGRLKVTKESFRTALEMICDNLRKEYEM